MSSLPALTSESAGPAGGHAPVLLEPALRALNLRGDGCYVDATFGRGGHSRAILERLGPAGQLVVFDQDPEALAVARELAAQDARVEVVAANFSGLQEALAGLGLVGCIDGLLMDLGVSSPQLDDGRRGFSFRFEGPLDMRMNPEAGESVAQWLARADEVDIANVLYRYGEERRSRRIARRIVEARAEEPLTGTLQLAEIISRAVGGRRGQKIHPATRSFQALRIFINRELEVLEQALPQALDVLAPGGRLAVISFHSLEDRIVKQFLRAAAQPPAPDVLSAPPPGRIGRPRRERCDELEARRNPRARSATLRWAELRA